MLCFVRISLSYVKTWYGVVQYVSKTLCWKVIKCEKI